MIGKRLTITFVKDLRFFRIVVFMVFFGVLFIGPGAIVTGPAEEPTEQQVKAAFIFNFVKFVEWPRHAFSTNESPVLLCVLGKDPLGDTLESLGGKTAQGRRLSVRYITKPGEADRCQVLYVSRSEREQIGVVLKGMKGNVLTIGDVRNFASSGGVINFVMKDSKVSFEINVDAAEKAGLQINSQLLKLAKIVRESARKEER